MNNEKEIKYTKGNIPIDEKLLNKYSNVKEIFMKELSNFDDVVNINKSILELDNIDIYKMTKTEVYHIAVKIFNSYHNKNVFQNDSNKIIVSNTDIKESINKINNNSLQRKYLKEHLLIFANLGSIIKSSKLVN